MGDGIRHPLFRPAIDGQTLDAIGDALAAGWLGMGPLTERFEEKVARFLGTDPALVVACNTGTSAIHLALMVAGVGPGEEVIVPSFGFVAAHQVIRAQGAVVRFCDIEDDTLTLDLAQAEELVTPRTRAVMPIHYGAQVPDAAVHEFAGRHGLRVIEDAAHVFGSEVRSHGKVGSFGDLVCFSFDPVKLLTCVDGGALVCLDRDDAARARRARVLGIDTPASPSRARRARYDVSGPGLRYHMNSVSAAVGLSQLRHVDEFVAARRSAFAEYDARLAGCEEVRRPGVDVDLSAPFLYWVRVRPDLRDALAEHLAERGIGSGEHFQPVHLLDAFRGCPAGSLTVTERVASQILTLPLHSRPPRKYVADVAAAVCDFFE